MENRDRRLNDTAQHLDGQIEKLRKLLVKNPVVSEIEREIEDYFKDKNHTTEQRDKLTIALMAEKITELDESLKRQIKR